MTLAPLGSFFQQDQHDVVAAGVHINMLPILVVVLSVTATLTSTQRLGFLVNSISWLTDFKREGENYSCLER